MSRPDPTVRGQELGEELRAIREAAGLTIHRAARRIDASPAKLSRVETGMRSAMVEDVAALLAVYDVTGAKRRELLNLARETEQRGWWQRNRPDFAQRQRTLIGLESKADRIVNFETVVIPGLLQTGEYTRAIMTECGYVPEDEIEGRMVARLKRHSILLRQRPPQLDAIIDELVLHRLVGGRDVLRRQLEHLVECSQRLNITIRVVPNAGHAHAGIDGSFILVRRSGFPAVVFVDSLTSSLFLEDRSEIASYESVLRRLSSSALDERQSIELIGELAKRLDTEASSDEVVRSGQSVLAQEQLQHW